MHKIKKRIISILVFIMILAPLPLQETDATSDTSITEKEDNQTQTIYMSRNIAAGTFGTSDWTIDNNGVLHIEAGTFAAMVSSSGPWRPYADSINKIIFEGNVIANPDSQYLFYALENVKEIENLNKFNTSNAVDMFNMFAYMSNLESLDVSNFNTSNVTNMNSMFYNLEKIKILDVSNWDTSNVRSMDFMFGNVKGISELDVGNWDTSELRIANYMFFNISNVTELNLSKWDTSNVTSMFCMFYGADKLNKLSLGEHFRFVKGLWSEAGLGPITMPGYTGRWVGVNGGKLFNTSYDFMEEYNGAIHADTYVWEELIEISTLSIEPVSDAIYNATAHVPIPEINGGTTQLVLDEDFEVSYQNNVNAGIATIHLTGLGIYTGTTSITFTINKATPIVKENPNTTIIYKNQPLSLSTLSGGVFEGVDGETDLEGTIKWKDVAQVVNATGMFEYIFTPKSSNYQSTSSNIEVKVNVNNYTIQFDAKGRTPFPTTQKVVDGEKIAEPTNTTKSNELFKGWYTDETYTTKWDFNNEVTSNMTLYAKWETQGITDPPKPESPVISNALPESTPHTGDSNSILSISGAALLCIIILLIITLRRKQFNHSLF